MKKIQPFFALVVMGALFFVTLYSSSCKREPVFIGELPGPIDTTPVVITHPCDPDSVYFQAQVLPILASNCAQSGCHDVQSHKEGVILTTYDKVLSTGDIKLNNPADSKIYKVLNKTDPEERMPPSPASPLSAEQKALILNWIQQGAQNLTCESNCDTTNVTYSGTVKPLLDLKCKGCHGTNNPGGGIKLTNYDEVKAQADIGKLLGSINHSYGFKPMPYPTGSNKLPQCEIDVIRIWVEAGAPNN
jgi:Planctomycete cytochrome C